MAKKKTTFEDELSQLKQSVNKLDNDGLTIEEALKTYEEGIASYKICRNILNKAGQKVRILNESMEKESFDDFEEGDL